MLLHASIYPTTHELKVPESFGKTHFIIGVDHQDIVKSSKPKRPQEGLTSKLLHPTKNKIEQAFFAPDHNTREIIVHLINSEQKSIKMAGFMITDSKIVQALKDAVQKRKVSVEVITDKGCIQSEWGKADMLLECGIPVHVYNSSKKNSRTHLMHHKFMIFNKNINNKSLLCNGSSNFTKSAYDVNEENIMVLESPHLIETFASQFEKIKTRCVPHQLVDANKKSPSVVLPNKRQMGTSDKLVELKGAKPVPLTKAPARKRAKTVV